MTVKILVCSPDYFEWDELGRLRAAMRSVAIQAWQQIPHMSVFAYQADPRDRWILADSIAEDSIYCIADDDCIPCPWLTVEHIEAMMNKYPDYGVLALDSGNPGSGYEDQCIKACHSVGGIRFIRKGMIEQWPASFTGDDSQHAGLMKMKSAYLKGYPMIHMGEWHSVWQKIRDGVPA